MPARTVQATTAGLPMLRTNPRPLQRVRYAGEDRRRFESLEGEVKAERQLPNEFRADAMSCGAEPG
jgi:hypothetical protein